MPISNHLILKISRLHLIQDNNGNLSLIVERKIKPFVDPYMDKRKPTDNCLLCEANQATQTNSHFVPAGLLNTNIGKRDYEEAYEISPSDPNPVKSFFGRSNLKNTNTELKQNLHTADYIFCPDCEKKLSVIESHVIPILTSVISRKNPGKYALKKSSTGREYIQVLNEDPKIIFLFFLTVIWRQCLQYRLSFGSAFLPGRLEENIRLMILPHLRDHLNGILESVSALNVMPYAILACIDQLDRTGNMESPIPFYKDPHIFFINDFIFIFSNEEAKLVSETNLLKIEGFSIEQELINRGLEPVNIIVLNDAEWNTTLTQYGDIQAKETYQNILFDLASSIGEGPMETKEILNSRAKEISIETGKNFTESLLQASEEIKEERRK